jgi:uncharacterized Rossmann fold enzyme
LESLQQKSAGILRRYIIELKEVELAHSEAFVKNESVKIVGGQAPQFRHIGAPIHKSAAMFIESADTSRLAADSITDVHAGTEIDACYHMQAV